jgi:hypothetical protein
MGLDKTTANNSRLGVRYSSTANMIGYALIRYPRLHAARLSAARTRQSLCGIRSSVKGSNPCLSTSWYRAICRSNLTHSAHMTDRWIRREHAALSSPIIAQGGSMMWAVYQLCSVSDISILIIRYRKLVWISLSSVHFCTELSFSTRQYDHPTGDSRGARVSRISGRDRRAHCRVRADCVRRR